MFKRFRSLLTAAVTTAALSGIVMLGSVVPVTTAQALGNDAALTPPMAWDGWNSYVAGGLEGDCIALDSAGNSYFNDAYFRGLADSFISTGLRAAGYDTIILTCGPEYRDSNGYLQPRPSKFASPNGIKELFDYFHSLGLKGQVYTDGGQGTCLIGGIGSFDHIQRDAETWAAWGADAIKIDWCGGEREGRDPSSVYPLYRDAIARATQATGRPMWIEACEFGRDASHEWGASASNFWRTDNDIVSGGNAADWGSVMRNLDSNLHHEANGPGHYNFPDMLLAGVPGLTPTEQQAQFSMWSIMASPLILPFDPRTMTQQVRDIVTNPEVIAVDQDPLGFQGLRVRNDNGLQVFTKRLADGAGSRAVALLNRTGSSAWMNVTHNDMGLTGDSATVRDLQARQGLSDSFGSIWVEVPSHGTALLKVLGQDKPSRVYDDAESSAWSYAGDWGSTTGSCDGRSNCSSHWSNQPGATATLTYDNSRMELRMITGSAGGIVGVQVDGRPEILFDTYSPVTRNDAVISELAGLPAGQHTLRLRVTGEQNAASSGIYVNVDRVITHP